MHREGQSGPVSWLVAVPIGIPWYNRLWAEGRFPGERLVGWPSLADLGDREWLRAQLC